VFLEEWEELPGGEKRHSSGRGISPKEICP